MASDASKLFSAAELINVDGRAFMMIPVYDWVVEMMDAAAAERRTELEFPDNGF